MYSTILFDLDGTLSDPYEGITKSVQYALANFGIAAEQPVLKRFIGPPLQTALQEYYGFTEEEAWQVVAKYRERFSDVGLFENTLYPGILELLTALKVAGKTLAVASSKPEVYVKRILEHFNIACFFDEVVGSELDGKRAKKAEVVAEALKRLGLPQGAENTLMVGDRQHDVYGAKYCGLPCAGAGYGYAEEGELVNAGAKYVFDSVEALASFLLA